MKVMVLTIMLLIINILFDSAFFAIAKEPNRNSRFSDITILFNALAQKLLTMYFIHTQASKLDFCR